MNYLRILSSPILLLLMAGAVSFAEAPATDPPAPTVRVVSVRRAFYNGEHNAFTDLTRFKGRFYLTFRSCPDGHMVHPTASIIILASDDTQSWQPVHRFMTAMVEWLLLVPQQAVHGVHWDIIWRVNCGERPMLMVASGSSSIMGEGRRNTVFWT